MYVKHSFCFNISSVKVPIFITSLKNKNFAFFFLLRVIRKVEPPMNPLHTLNLSYSKGVTRTGNRGYGVVVMNLVESGDG